MFNPELFGLKNQPKQLSLILTGARSAALLGFSISEGLM